MLIDAILDYCRSPFEILKHDLVHSVAGVLIHVIAVLLLRFRAKRDNAKAVVDAILPFSF